jgi:hypothetical protein
MWTGINEPKDEVHQVDQLDNADIHHGLSEIKIDPNVMSDAIDGENLEHEMSMWAAFKLHP